MYEAKSAGRTHYELFDQRMQIQVASRLHIETDLRNALDRGQLRLHFQPIISAADSSVVSVEALLRWQHPDRGMLPPAEFIPIAEETGLIVPIGAWVLEGLADKLETGCPGAVRISAVGLREPIGTATRPSPSSNDGQAHPGGGRH